MEAALLDFQRGKPVNMLAWLWTDTDLSDVTLAFTTSCVSPALNVGSPKAAGHGDAVQAHLFTEAAAYVETVQDNDKPQPIAESSGLVPQLDIAGSSGTTSGSAKLPTGNRVFQLHSTVLCSNSAYFRARITGAVGMSCVGSKRHRAETMQEFMEVDECEAAECVLRFFYTSLLQGKGGGTCSPEFLLNMVKVADRWQAPEALTAFSSVLRKLHLDLFPTAAVYSLPAVLRSAPGFQAVSGRAHQSLLHVFGDATAVATSPALLKQFLSLPHGAVLALIQSRALATDAEATVLLLLSEWLISDHGRACTDEQKLQLNACIRYSRLSLPYLTELCDNSNTPPLTVKQRMELWYFRSLSGEAAERAIFRPSVLENPLGWYYSTRPTPAQSRRNSPPALPKAAPLRRFSGIAGVHGRRGPQPLPSPPPTPAAPPTTSITLQVTEAELLKLLQAIKEEAAGQQQNIMDITSKPVYSQGFWWTLQLLTGSGQLWCGIMVHGVFSLLIQDPGLQFKHGIVCDHSIKTLGKTPAQEVVQYARTARPVDSRGVAFPFKSGEGATLGALDMQWWQPHVVEGCITFTATVTNICS